MCDWNIDVTSKVNQQGAAFCVIAIVIIYYSEGIHIQKLDSILKKHV